MQTLLPLLGLLASCVVSPQPSPPNLADEAVFLDVDPTDDRLVDGIPLAAQPGAVAPPVGVIVATNWDDTRPPVAEPVQPDGSFDIVVPGSPADVIRLQVRSGGARSTPLDLSWSRDGLFLEPPPQAFADCLSLEPPFELDFGAVRRGRAAQLRLELSNECGVPLTFAASRLRTPGSFAVTSDVTALADGEITEIVIEARPEELGTTERLLLLETSAPMRDRRALTLFVVGAD